MRPVVSNAVDDGKGRAGPQDQQGARCSAATWLDQVSKPLRPYRSPWLDSEGDCTRIGLFIGMVIVSVLLASSYYTTTKDSGAFRIKTVEWNSQHRALYAQGGRTTQLVREETASAASSLQCFCRNAYRSSVSSDGTVSSSIVPQRRPGQYDQALLSSSQWTQVLASASVPAHPSDNYYLPMLFEANMQGLRVSNARRPLLRQEESVVHLVLLDMYEYVQRVSTTMQLALFDDFMRFGTSADEMTNLFEMVATAGSYSAGVAAAQNTYAQTMFDVNRTASIATDASTSYIQPLFDASQKAATDTYGSESVSTTSSSYLDVCAVSHCVLREDVGEWTVFLQTLTVFTSLVSLLAALLWAGYYWATAKQWPGITDFFRPLRQAYEDTPHSCVRSVAFFVLVVLALTVGITQLMSNLDAPPVKRVHVKHPSQSQFLALSSTRLSTRERTCACSHTDGSWTLDMLVGDLPAAKTHARNLVAAQRTASMTVFLADFFDMVDAWLESIDGTYPILSSQDVLRPEDLVAAVDTHMMNQFDLFSREVMAQPYTTQYIGDMMSYHEGFGSTASQRATGYAVTAHLSTSQLSVRELMNTTTFTSVLEQVISAFLQRVSYNRYFTACRPRLCSYFQEEGVGTLALKASAMSLSVSKVLLLVFAFVYGRMVRSQQASPQEDGKVQQQEQQQEQGQERVQQQQEQGRAEQELESQGSCSKLCHKVVRVLVQLGVKLTGIIRPMRLDFADGNSPKTSCLRAALVCLTYGACLILIVVRLVDFTKNAPAAEIVVQQPTAAEYKQLAAEHQSLTCTCAPEAISVLMMFPAMADVVDVFGFHADYRTATNALIVQAASRSGQDGTTVPFAVTLTMQALYTILSQMTNFLTAPSLFPSSTARTRQQVIDFLREYTASFVHEGFSRQTLSVKHANATAQLYKYVGIWAATDSDFKTWSDAYNNYDMDFVRGLFISEISRLLEKNLIYENYLNKCNMQRCVYYIEQGLGMFVLELIVETMLVFAVVRFLLQVLYNKCAASDSAHKGAAHAQSGELHRQSHNRVSVSLSGRETEMNTELEDIGVNAAHAAARPPVPPPRGSLHTQAPAPPAQLHWT